MQVVRKQWIDDAKMGTTTGSQPEDGGQADHVPETQAVPERQRSVQGASGSQRQRTPPPLPEEEEDIYSATPGAQRVWNRNSGPVAAQENPEPTALDRLSAASDDDDDDDDDDDELDALFKVASHSKANVGRRTVQQPQHGPSPNNSVRDSIDNKHDNDDDVDDDLDALLAEHEQRAALDNSALHTRPASQGNPRVSSLSSAAPHKPSRSPADELSFDDDMEALNELDVAW